jgi:hypothetical protein
MPAPTPSSCREEAARQVTDAMVEAVLTARQQRAEALHDRILAAREAIRVNLSPDSPEWLREAFNQLHAAHHILGGDPFDMHMRAALTAALSQDKWQDAEANPPPKDGARP